MTESQCSLFAFTTCTRSIRLHAPCQILANSATCTLPNSGEFGYMFALLFDLKPGFFQLLADGGTNRIAE